MKKITPEEECGYCRKVQNNRGGNRGYQCAKHRKRVTMKSVTFYTQEHLDKAIASAVKAERVRISEEVEKMKPEDTHLDDPSHCSPACHRSGAAETIKNILPIINPSKE